MNEPAIFSPCRQYRYLLRRRVGFGERSCLFVMLNASKADEQRNDPTIRRDIGFAKAWGYGWLEAVNIFAWAATDPRELYKVDDPIGPENDHYIAEAALRNDIVIVAWGNHGAYLGRGQEVMQMLLGICPGKIYHLGLTKEGHPRHPLYVSRATPLERLEAISGTL